MNLNPSAPKQQIDRNEQQASKYVRVGMLRHEQGSQDAPFAEVVYRQFLSARGNEGDQQKREDEQGGCLDRCRGAIPYGYGAIAHCPAEEEDHSEGQGEDMAEKEDQSRDVADNK